MSQEVIIVRCFSCETFQGQIQKKAKKWECKICGEKQSLKKIYGRGSGKDCRQHTQYLNEMRGKLHETEGFVEDDVSTSYTNSAEFFNTPVEHDVQAPVKPSKWDRFVERKLKVPDDGDGVQQELYKATDKSPSKITKLKQFKTSGNKYNFFETSDITHNNWKISDDRIQCSETYPTSAVTEKSAVKLDGCKPVRCNLNLIPNSSVNRVTKYDYNEILSRRNKKYDTLMNVNEETTASVESSKGISVFDQDADFDSILDF